MPRRYGERVIATRPDHVVPPIESTAGAASGAGSPGASALRTSARMHTTASPRNPQETSSRFAVPRGAARNAVSVGPARAPQLPPAEMKPNRRAACAGRNKSAIRLQNSETTNRLNTLTHTKNARATQDGAAPLEKSA